MPTLFLVYEWPKCRGLVLFGGILSPTRRKIILQNTALILASLVFSFIAIEIGFRLLDPTPYFSDAEINNTEHGNLSVFDEMLGWKGAPGGSEVFVTRNNRVQLSHNSQGFRDIEHSPGGRNAPAIVFLGDSFTWGYEVEFDQMFVNRLRGSFPQYEIFNLAHRGYGTDQSFLTFKKWSTNRTLGLVVLMFSENDNGDNNAIVNYRKAKPRFEIRNNKLALTGVPILHRDSWPETNSSNEEDDKEPFREALKTFFYSSHFFNNMRVRNKLYRNRKESEQAAEAAAQRPESERDYALTARILEELRKEVTRRGSRLVVVFIPSKREIDQLDDSKPYQSAIAAVCEELGITYFDLAPALMQSSFRTYYPQGMHWNARGHALAAVALETFLSQQLTP